MLLSLLLATSAHAFTYEDLVSLIQQKHLTSVEEVLPLLPEDLRANYSLMYDTLSLQASDELQPRAILFGKDARFTLTFNGSNAQAGGDTIELYQWRESERAFDFRQIQFPTPENGLTKVVFSERNKTADGSISCTACHGADPRPNWNAYSFWRGAYGGEDDSLELGKEVENYAAFVSARATHPRYRFLVQDSQPKAPFQDDHDYSAIHTRPNLRLSDLTTALTAVRNSRITEEKLTHWQRLAFALGGLGCTLTDDQKSALQKRNPRYDRDMDMDALFTALGVTKHDWSPTAFDDGRQRSTPYWDHQGGYAFMAAGLAGVEARKLADAGDEGLKTWLGGIEAGLAKEFSDRPDMVEFTRTMNGITPFQDRFGMGFTESQRAMCAGLSEHFLAEYPVNH